MIIKSALKKGECAELVEYFDASANKNNETDEFYGGSIGLYQPPVSLKHVGALEKIIAKQYGPLVFQNTYMRSYTENSMLKLHTDRPGLDVTLTVCLEHNFDGEYPLLVSNNAWEGLWYNNLEDYSAWMEDNTATELAVGQGVVVEGCKYPHWREAFPFSTRGVYIFYHWSYLGA